MAENNPFYTEEDLKAGTHPGWIADPTIAESVAYVEKDEGKDAALALEKSLKAFSMDPIEEENNDVVDFLLEQYPYVFIEEIDPKTGERYIATSESIFWSNIRSMYLTRYPDFNEHIVADRFEGQIKNNKQESQLMRKFYDADYLTLFSKHGFLTARGRLYENLPNYPRFNYNPEDRWWRNIRGGMGKTYLEELSESLALYQRIGEEFHREIEERGKRRFSMDTMRAEIQKAKDQVKRD